MTLNGSWTLQHLCMALGGSWKISAQRVHQPRDGIQRPLTGGNINVLDNSDLRLLRHIQMESNNVIVGNKGK